MNEKEAKVQQNYVIEAFSDPSNLTHYSDDVFKIGLWQSEKAFCTKYFPKEGKILDIGCGAGRTTFGLYKLGYQKIIGIDLTPNMIEEARTYSEKLGLDIRFEVGDACNLKYPDSSVDGCLFSFNGIMQIPGIDNRIKALTEIQRVLKPGGVFIFTTHIRGASPEWKPFWNKEEEKWSKGNQDQRIFEFGDRIVEDFGRLIFLHFPDRAEVCNCITQAGLELINEAWFSEIVAEPEAVKKRVAGCRFWVVKKV